MKTELTADQLGALRLLGVYTMNYFNISSLTGPHNAARRARIFSLWTGRTVPQSQAGVTALTKAFYDVAQPEGDCIAAKEDAFEVWARSQFAEVA